MKYLPSLFFITTILGCSNSKPKIPELLSKEHFTENNSRLTPSTVDSIIYINSKHNIIPNKHQLKKKEAESILYDYFAKKGILPKSIWFLKSTVRKGEVIVDYDTVYNINSKNLSGAIVSYWLGPWDLNGHCFQPKKSLLLNSSKGYIIAHENIIPSSYTIDSVKGNCIFGYEFECGGRGVLKQFRIELK